LGSSFLFYVFWIYTVTMTARALTGHKQLAIVYRVIELVKIAAPS
jgi:hypothetical protein